ncbi:hypothetical protein IWW51_006653, partial [Coemansia sp. RSA 2702]
VRKFQAAEHFNTLPEFVGRKHNRPKLETLDQDDISRPATSVLKRAMKVREERLRELKDRLEREEQLRLAESEMRLRHALKEKGDKKKVGRDRLGLAIYKWKAERKNAAEQAGAGHSRLWNVYDSVLGTAKYVDLTHTIEPAMPIWRGFGNITFSPAVNRLTGKPFTYADNLFVANAYQLTTDQMGTQLDAPVHFNPYFAAADEIPATFALRKLVVID